ncbi:hypothetical protein JT359_16955 [Candidatus Poribacteria bacterium]|nr:hypothetical protein [Candidatus Poribacteria bacterium]
MKNILLIFTILSFVVSISGCGDPVEALDQPISTPFQEITPEDLTSIINSMSIPDVKTSFSTLDVELKEILGVHLLNSLDSESGRLAGTQLNSHVRDGAASVLLDELIAECTTEIGQLAQGAINQNELNSLINTPCVTNMRYKFRDLSPAYSTLVELMVKENYPDAPEL